MMPDDALIRQVRAALEREPHVDLHHHPIKARMDHDALVLEGEVGSVAAKKLALACAAAVPGIAAIIDRLHVEPLERPGDGAVRDRVLANLEQDRALQVSGLRVLDGNGRGTLVRATPPESNDEIVVRVEEGVVTLSGQVNSLSHKRLAGVLCWWARGVRDVVNGLEVVPDEADNGAELTDALRLVLDKDPSVDATQIRAHAEDDHTVVLEGLVAAEGQRHAAERDAWFVFGVDRVVNRIEVQS
ncbi:BON domain-containing protein [Ectothiorhodospiraceae bacterium 2226]|nr:BON domain-containing protein [Ectothiorhodospiraceae bacterium 2226]